MGKVRGDVEDEFGGEIDLHRIAESFGEEKNFFAVVRPIGALTEAGDASDVWREIFGGIAGKVSSMARGVEKKKCGDDSPNDPKVHKLFWRRDRRLRCRRGIFVSTARDCGVVGWRFHAGREHDGFDCL